MARRLRIEFEKIRQFQYVKEVEFFWGETEHIDCKFGAHARSEMGLAAGYNFKNTYIITLKSEF